MTQRVGHALNKAFKAEFIVPNYYKNFKCKGSDCQNTCCSGWKVVIPMEEYFVLHGISCNKKLREKMDRTFKVLPQPTPKRYAEINHNYLGNCPLLMENGYCELHSSCGEEILPSVCRYFPRGPRIDYKYECSCSNGCEKTLELLFEDPEIVTQEVKVLEFKMPFIKNEIVQHEKALYDKVRAFCFEILNDRRFTLVDRILKIGVFLNEVDKDNNVDFTSINLNIVTTEKDVFEGIKDIEILTEWFISNSSLADKFMTVKEMYRNDVFSTYKNNLEAFNRSFPEHEIYFEKMLYNNMFFRQFPFRDSLKTFYDSFISLCGIYIFMRYLGINLTVDKNTVKELVAVMTKLFRMISHTNFDKNITNLIKSNGLSDSDKLINLIKL